MPNNVSAGYALESSRGLKSAGLIEEVCAIQGRDEKSLGLEYHDNNNGLGFLPQEQQHLYLLEDNPNAIADGCVGNVVFALDGSALAWTVSSSQVVIVPWQSVEGRVDCTDPDKWRVTINTGSEPGMGPTSLSAVTALALVRVSSCPGIRERISQKDVIDGTHGQYLLWTSLLGRLLAADLLLVTGHVNGVIRIWNGYTGRLLAKLVDNKSKILSLNFAPDGSLRLGSAHADHTIKLWDLLDDGNMYKTLRGHNGSVSCVAWSPNGRRLASVGEGRQVRIWDMENGHQGDTPCVRICGGHKNKIVSCQFTQDGALLATASHDTSVILWDSRTGNKVGCLYHVLPAPHLIYASGLNSCWIRDLALFPDGCHAATVSDDKKLRVWDLAQGDKPVAEKVLPAPARCCVVSPKGNTIVVGFGNGEVKFFRPRCLEVASLLHLSRLALRKNVVPLPSQIEDLPLPRTLKPYLLYRDWV